MIEEEAQARVVLTPTPGVDPRSALATSMHAAPGVYAVLVGSGMSSAAGIPTGWQIVQSLIARVAIAEGAAPEELGDRPEEWWTRQGRGEPRYDRLLDVLASTDAARQGLLRAYFDPEPGSPGTRTPTAAHEALAWLCATGRVRVILTTNFDRLIERALDAAGVAPQVIAGPGALRGMIPLAHARATVVKVHGDYLSSGLRNTPAELARYPAALNRLLARVLDEYGLVVVGWSGEHDVALREAISCCPTRRYPMYWASFREEVTEQAAGVMAARRAAHVPTRGADEFLTDLVSRVERLDRVASRRRRPGIVRSTRYPLPESVPAGWRAMPLLRARVVGVVGEATLDECGLIGPEHRSAMLTAVRGSPLTSRLGALMREPRKGAASYGREHTPVHDDESYVRARDWIPAPGAHQSTDHACYRLGGDAASGVSTLVTVKLPGTGAQTSSVLFVVDVGCSLPRALGLGELAFLLRDGLVMAAMTLPDTIADVLPADAGIVAAELHVGLHSASPGDRLATLVDLASLGERSRALPDTMGCAAHVPGGLTSEDCAALVVAGINYMALASGHLDPRGGVAGLQAELGVAPA